MSNESPKTQSILDILSNKKEKVKVFIKSQEREVSASSMNLKQQKDLISTAINGIEGVLDLVLLQNKISMEGTGLDDLLIFDNVPIIVALRKDSLGDNIVVEGKLLKAKVSDILDNIKQYSDYKFEISKTVEIDGISLYLKIPSMKMNENIISKCIQELKRDKSNDSTTVGVLYIFELIKYVDKISIGEETVEFKDLSIPMRVKYIESLPLKFYEELAKFLSQVTTYEKKILTVGDEVVSIDADFFDITLQEE